MAKDYKHRALPKNKNPKQTIAFRQWILIGSLVVAFITFLYFLRDSNAPQTVTVNPAVPPVKSLEKQKKESLDKETPKPRFNFYTILPEKEVIISESEIKTRKREEQLGRSKPSNYILQVGSFRQYQEADKLKAKLALLDIQAKVEPTEIGSTTWNRVKIGPFSNMNAVDELRSRLRENNIDVVVYQRTP